MRKHVTRNRNIQNLEQYLHVQNGSYFYDKILDTIYNRISFRCKFLKLTFSNCFVVFLVCNRSKNQPKDFLSQLDQVQCIGKVLWNFQHQSLGDYFFVWTQWIQLGGLAAAL